MRAVFNNLAAVLQDEGRLPEAQKRFEEALEIAINKKDQTAIARAVGNLGELALLRGDQTAAQKYFEQQLTIGDQIHEQKQRAYALYGLGCVSWQRGDSKRANALLVQAFELRQKAGEKDLVLETRLAQVEIASVQPTPAALSEARDLAEQFHKEERFDQEVLTDAALIRVTVNLRPTKLQMSRTAASEVERLLPRIQDYSIRLSARASLAQYNAASGKNQIAVDELRSVIQDAASGGYTVHELESTLLLAHLRISSEERSRLLEEVYRKASMKGLSRIARETMSLISEPPHQAALSTQH